MTYNRVNKAIENSIEQNMLMERIARVALEHPDRSALVDAASRHRLSYAELDRLSGKIYGYLKGRGIGREDVVMICLPRGIAALVAVLGVWKAGAALTMIELDYPQEKRQFIYRDCQCKLLIDQLLFEEMMECEPLVGFENTDTHDLCFIIYTSGTTGKPKGVMHEYGSLYLNILNMRYEGRDLYEESDRFALSSPLNFVVTFMFSIPVFYKGGTLIILTLNVVKKPHKLISVLQDYRVNCAFFTPSLMRLIPRLNPGFKRLFLGGEPVQNIRYPGVEVYAAYGQSESAMVVTWTRSDACDGASSMGVNQLDPSCCVIRDAKGHRTDDVGELCYYQPYFRGYHGLPELTNKSTRGGLVHSGDLVRKDARGRLDFLGRIDDMIKINGNRVEPAEVECAVRDVMGLEWVAAKGIKDTGRAYVCAYYIGEPAISIDHAKELLQNRLPDYMVPARFIKIEEIPLNENGKFARRLLPDPILSTSGRDYVAPRNEREAQLCRAMARVLGLDRVGIRDDFYELGGDSLQCISLITELEWPELEANLVFRKRTPEKIAEAYAAIKPVQEDVDLTVENRKVMAREVPITVLQRFMIDHQLYDPSSIVWNNPVLLRFQESCDAETLWGAVQTALEQHPVFSTLFNFNEDGEIVHRYSPEYRKEVVIESVSEDELTEIKPDLIRPFKLIGSPLYRVRLFRTEKAMYLFLDMHHAITDGTSIHIVLDDIKRAYLGEELDEDLYYWDLEQRLAEVDSQIYQEGRAYFESLLDHTEWDRFPKLDRQSREHTYGELKRNLPISEEMFASLTACDGISKNELFQAATVIAISCYNRCDKVKINWISTGRETALQQKIVGTCIRELYLGIRLRGDMSLAELFQELQRQNMMALKYSCYPYPGMERLADDEEDLTLIFQNDLLDFSSSEGLQYEMVDLESEEPTVDNRIQIQVSDRGESCDVDLEYNASCYDAESMERFLRLILGATKMILAHAGELSVCLKDIDEKLMGVG